MIRNSGQASRGIISTCFSTCCGNSSLFLFFKTSWIAAKHFQLHDSLVRMHWRHLSVSVRNLLSLPEEDDDDDQINTPNNMCFGRWSVDLQVRGFHYGSWGVNWKFAVWNDRFLTVLIHQSGRKGWNLSAFSELMGLCLCAQTAAWWTDRQLYALVWASSRLVQLVMSFLTVNWTSSHYVCSGFAVSLEK